ncbi:MAG: DUF3180 domain-containing protein [Nesterenkonia sp.]
MSQLRPVWLLIIAAAASLAGFLATVVMASAGLSSPVLPMHSAITLSAVGLIVLGLGIVVFRDQRLVQQSQQQRGRQPRRRRSSRKLHPLQAVRVVAAGQACAYAGALIAGWHGGVTLDLAPAAGMSTPNVSSSLVMMIGGLLWVIIGFVVESLCRLPPDQGDQYEEGDFDEEDGTEPNVAF